VGGADHPSRGVLSEYGVSECDRIDSTMSRSWPSMDSCAMERIRIVNSRYLLSLLVAIVCKIFQPTCAKIFYRPFQTQMCISHSLHIHY
jgi:hypothetical protein